MSPPPLEPWPHTSPFLDAALGPLQVAPGTTNLTMEVASRHTNSRGGVHGGLLATLADLCLGHTMKATVEPSHDLSTASLSIDYISTARMGERLEASAEVLRVSTHLGFARCIVAASDRTVVRASGVFAIRPPRPR